MRWMVVILSVTVVFVSCSKAHRERRVTAKQAANETCDCLQPLFDVYREYRPLNSEITNSDASQMMDQAMTLVKPCFEQLAAKYYENEKDPRFNNLVKEYLETNCADWVKFNQMIQAAPQP